MEEIHHGRNSRNLVNDGLSEYPYLVLHRKCLDMLRRFVDYRKYLLNRGIDIAGPNSLSQFHEVLAFRMTEDFMRQYAPWVANYRSDRARTHRRAIEPHFYYFRDYRIYRDVEWPIGRPDVIVRSWSIIEDVVPCLTVYSGIRSRAFSNRGIDA